MASTPILPPVRHGSASTSSSGDRTIRGRRSRRSSSASGGSALTPRLVKSIGQFISDESDADNEEDLDEEQDRNEPDVSQVPDSPLQEQGLFMHPSSADNGRFVTHPLASHTAATASRPSSEWREPSPLIEDDNPYDDDPEQGPSDYWRRPSPPISPPQPGPEARPTSTQWLRPVPVNSEAETPDGMADDSVDVAEYTRRLEQVLTLAQDTPSPSPSKVQHGNGYGNTTVVLGHSRDDEGSDFGGEWEEYHVPNGRGYDAAVRDILDEREGDPLGNDDEKGEEEFGILRTPLRDDSSDRTPSTSSVSISGRDRFQSARINPSPSGAIRSFIHPSVSRLRSQPAHRMSSSSTQQSLSSIAGRHARMPSHFSQVSLSRSDSFSTASVAGPSSRPVVAPPLELQNVASDVREQGPAFTFHPLRHLSAHLFNRRNKGGASSPVPQPTTVRKASAVLGLPLGGTVDSEPRDIGYGRPTVMDINGVIAVGTEGGWVIVYGFGQDIRCVLGNEAIVSSSGAVTSVTISPDETFIGVGHASGNIYLYDLSNPAKPARTTLALTIRQVLSGRKEGHLQGSRILHIGFVGKRHTSIVSADEDGRAFWWSLGRVMGVDSNDVVRMLGSYPDREREAPPMASNPNSPRRLDGSGITGASAGSNNSAPSSIRSHPSKHPTTLFAALTLPLGEKAHPTDEFHFTALLTPVKLVVVGMKPSAKTWFRRIRDTAGGEYGGFVGCASWLRSGEVVAGSSNDAPSDPVLAYAWGTAVRFLRARIAVTPAVKVDKAEPTRTPEFVEGRRWEAPHPVYSLHWYDSDHVLIITQSEVILLNVRSMSAVENTPLQTRLLTSQDFYGGLSLRKAAIDVAPDSIAGSARTYRGKLFLLTKANVQVGTLQHWNDRVLANVHRGDFLAAITLALSYYEGRAPGNKINLPDDADARKDVVGARVRELMRASLEWAFSEDRMRDDTHFSADGRGVDLTALFEGLAGACIEACLAMDDTSFLFDDAYEHFANAGIHGIFLARLEGYIFDGRITDVPPNVVQALIAMHDQREEYALAEAVIWHVAPNDLDINQAVTLCERRGLWDALIHVYTRAMGDYIAPIVKLIGVVCDVQRYRRQRPSLVGGDHRDDDSFSDSTSDEYDNEARLAPDAYKLYSYIEHVLSGLWYPSGETMNEVEANQARTDAYGLIFSDGSVEWPEGSDSPELVLTSDDGYEPAYPYLNLLLRFDTETFLHAMDIAFEDSYLNDSSRAINRQSIINLMLDVMDHDFHSSDVTFLHIFVARNLPKYPQFIFIPPSTSHRILVSLAADPDQSTREDRQLAAEYLLSVYTPHDADAMLARFEQAGFFRILRAAYRREHKWAALIGALLKDPDVDDEVFPNLDDIIAASKSSLGIIPVEVSRALSDALPNLFDLSVRRTARFLDRSIPSLHDTAITALEGAEHKQAAYLRCLLDPASDEGDDLDSNLNSLSLSTQLTRPARHKYVILLAHQDPSAVLPFLDARGADYFDLPLLAQQCEAADMPEGQLWALDRQGKISETFETVTAVLNARGTDLAEGLVDATEGQVHMALQTLDGVAKMAVRLCREHSGDPKIEDIWFGVLHTMTDLVHSISALGHGAKNLDSGQSHLGDSALDTLRAIVQDTLQALLSTSSSSLSFARLFKRLVEAAPGGRQRGKGKSTSSGERGARAYSEFRAILSGMLESFRTDSDVLALSIRLVDADVYDLFEEKVTRSIAGWRPRSTVCAVCAKPLWETGVGRNIDKGKGTPKVKGAVSKDIDTVAAVIVVADGNVVHAACQI